MKNGIWGRGDQAGMGDWWLRKIVCILALSSQGLA